MAALHIDAHTDAYPYDATEKYNSATQFTHVAEEGLVDPEFSWHVGIRSTTYAQGVVPRAMSLGYKIVSLDDPRGERQVEMRRVADETADLLARGEILALREKEFIEAAVAQGKGPIRIMVSELLPNVVSTIIVFFTLNIANNMLLESSLSFLGAGVRPPNASWGTMIADGYQNIYTAPHLTIVPGIMIVLTVLSLNVFGDGLRDALDPRAKIRLEH